MTFLFNLLHTSLRMTLDLFSEVETRSHRSETSLLWVRIGRFMSSTNSFRSLHTQYFRTILLLYYMCQSFASTGFDYLNRTHVLLTIFLRTRELVESPERNLIGPNFFFPLFENIMLSRVTHGPSPMDHTRLNYKLCQDGLSDRLKGLPLSDHKSRNIRVVDRVSSVVILK